ncbi:MAG: hypothetical protein PVJ08_05535 [Dehalococcoidia bacterium]|jgi:hypothetical protein
MYIRSTGLGKTLLQCQVESVESSVIVPSTLEATKEGEEGEPTRLLMTMKVIAPVSWTVRAFVEPADLRAIIGFVLKNPRVLFGALRFLVFGGRSPSLEVKKKETGEATVERKVPSIPTDLPG